jgi:hypothetical protein
MDRSAWHQFLEEIEEAQAGLSSSGAAWYRGHSNAAWSLMPGLFRINGGLEAEARAFHEFRRSAARLFEKHSSDWEMLFDMQHHGIPTRLLDWTENLGVAIAFVLHTDYGHKTDSAVFVLDPLALNRLSGIQEVKQLPGDAGFDYQNIYFRKQPFAPVRPIAVVPPLHSARLFAQRGTFTIHGDTDQALEAQCPNAVRKVILPLAARDAAWEFLQHAALDEYTIYPDIVGMARHIRRKVFDV